jgi:hypothetical protein
MTIPKDSRPQRYILVVLMAMVDVWVVRMPAPKRFMAAPVRMRLRHRSFVSVLMIRIVDMAVLVLDRLVRVFSLVLFGWSARSRRLARYPLALSVGAAVPSN